jgi:hypothetical protein
MRRKRLLLSYPVYPIFPNCVVKSDRRIGITATDAIGHPLFKTTLFPIKRKFLSNFEQSAAWPLDAIVQRTDRRMNLFRCPLNGLPRNFRLVQLQSLPERNSGPLGKQKSVQHSLVAHGSLN